MANIRDKNRLAYPLRGPESGEDSQVLRPTLFLPISLE